MKKIITLSIILLISLHGVSQSSKKLFDNGKALYDQGQYPEAIEVLSEFITKSDVGKDNYANAYVYRAWSYYKLDENDKAIDDFKSGISFGSQYKPWAYLGKGTIYFENKDYENAISEFTSSISFNDDYVWPYLYRSLCYIQQGDKYDLGLTDINKAIEINPKVEMSYTIRASIYVSQANYSKAESDYNKTIDINPSSKNYSSRAAFFVRTFEYKKAEEDINKALSLDANNSDGYFYQGKLFSYQRKFKEAIKAYEKGNQIKEGSLYYNQIARNQYYLGNFDKAIATINQAIELEPENATLWLEKGRINYFGLYNISEANKCFTKVIELNNPTALVDAYFFLGDVEKAITLAKEMVSNENPSYWDLYRLAYLYALADDTKNAIYYLDQAIKEGLSDYGHIFNDYDLNNIKYKKEFANLLKKYEIPFDLDNTTLVQSYVQASVNKWQKKEKYEKTAVYLERVNKQTRDKYIKEATEQGIQQIARQRVNVVIEDTRYNPDSEVFQLQMKELNNITVKVPNNEAEIFDNNLSKLQLTPTFALSNDNDFIISSLVIYNPASGKQYVSDNELEIGKNINNMVFNFAPIEIELEKQEASQRNQSSTISAQIDSDIDTNIPKTNQSKPTTFAVIIGNEDYSSYQVDRNTEIDVDFAKRDASLFKEYVIHTLGVPEKNVTLLLDATSGQMNQAIHKLVNLAKVHDGEAELLFYYAGHGLPQENTNESYLIPVDVSGYTIQYGINLNDLYDNLTKYPVKRTLVFLDACFSGAARNESLVAMRGMKKVPKEYPIKEKLIVFTSSSGTQSSMGYDEKGHGFFTYYLLKEIQQSQGEISLMELGDNVAQKVRRNSVLVKNKEQTPQILVNPLKKGEMTNSTLLDN